MGLNVLVVDRAAPRTLIQGDELIARQLFPRLRRRHRLTLLAAELPTVPGSLDLDGLFDAVRLVPRARRIPALVGALEPLAVRLPGIRGRKGLGPLNLDFARRFDAALHELLAAERFDVVHVRQLPVGAYGVGIRHPARLLELMDSETLAADRSRVRGPRALARRAVARVVEATIARRFDAITTVAEADAAAVRRIAPGVEVTVVPNGVDADYFEPGAADPLRHASEAKELPAPGGIVFVGAMHFPPNVDAVRWFVADVLPRIRERRPDATLHIVGRDPVPAVRELGTVPWVTVTGRVDDVRPYLEAASVVVCPMVSGGGIKNKLLEAMSMARPVVVTSLALGGLPLVDGRDLRVADDARRFAVAVVELLDDPGAAAGLGRSARDAVVSGFSWDAAAEAYDELYGRLVARAARAGAGLGRS